MTNTDNNQKKLEQNRKASVQEGCNAEGRVQNDSAPAENMQAERQGGADDSKTATKGIWASSAAEFGELRNIVFCGVMGALSVVLSFVGSIRLNPYMKIGVSEIPNLMVDYLMGPVVGGVFGAVMDFLKFFINPDGSFFPGFAISAAVAAVIFGVFLYHKKVTFWRVLVPEILVKLIVNVGLNTLWLDMLYGKGFWALLPHRIVSNLIQLPIDTLVVFAVLTAVQKAAKKYWRDRK